MKRKVAIGAFTIVLVLSILIAGYYMLSENSNQIDYSWVNDVNQFLEESKPYPNPSEINIMLSSYQLYLGQNESTQLILWANQNHAFYSYLKDLILQVNQQRNASITQDTLNQILSSSKVAFLDYRFPEDIGIFTDIQNAYFILESNMDKELQGTIIIEQTNENEYFVSSWVIKK